MIHAQVSIKGLKHPNSFLMIEQGETRYLCTY